MTLDELNEHRDLRAELRRAEEMLENLRAAASPASPALTGMPRGSGYSDKVGDLAVEIAEMEDQVNLLRARIADSEEAVMAFIRSVGDIQLRLIFRLRFIRCLSWGEVAGLVGVHNTEVTVKSSCYRYLNSETCNAMLRDVTP